MNTNLAEKASRIAARPYSVLILHDETTTERPIFVAKITELQGCIAQGFTMEEALHNLRHAATDYIYSLLEDGLPVPAPSIPITAVSSASSSATFPSAAAHPAFQPGHLAPAHLYEFLFTIR